MMLYPTSVSLNWPPRGLDPGGEKPDPLAWSSWSPILRKWISSIVISSNEPVTTIPGSPEVRPTDWAFTRRCATAGSRVLQT